MAVYWGAIVVMRLIGVLLLVILLAISGAITVGAQYTETHVAAYQGTCNAQRSGTCLVDMRVGLIVHWSYWSEVNSDWQANAPLAVFTGTIDGEIYLFDGRRQIRLTDHPERNTLPVWSPDGTHIAYTRVHRSNDIDLYVMDADGGSPRPMQTELVSLNSAPIWSPDGSNLAYFTRLIDNNTQIWRLSIDGAPPFPLGTTIGNDASWSPDGAQLAYTGSRGYKQFIADVGTGETVLEREVATRPDVAFWVSWSPDGQHIAYIYQQRNRAERLSFVEVYNIETGIAFRPTAKPYTMSSKPHWADANHILQPVFSGRGSIHQNSLLLINVGTGHVRHIPIINIEQFIGVVQW